MSSISAIALSGMNAAMLRLGAAASNIANARSNGALPGAGKVPGEPTAYTPVDVVQTPSMGGGAQARTVPSPAPPIEIYDPGASYADSRGMVASPNVDLAGEIAQLVSARHEFSANLLVMRIDQEMSARLLDIKA